MDELEREIGEVIAEDEVYVKLDGQIYKLEADDDDDDN